MVAYSEALLICNFCVDVSASNPGQARKQLHATGSIFSDVDLSHWVTDWIGQLYRDGITTGCKKTPLMYCPSKHVARAQMAVFLTRMLGL